MIVIMLVLAGITAALVVASVWGDRRHIGTPKALIVIASWLAIPSVLYPRVAQEFSASKTLLIVCGIIWYALLVTGGRLVYMTDLMLRERSDEEPMTAEDRRINRRVRSAQIAMIAGALVAAVFAVFAIH
ncbi:hypothetical protein [Kribbella sp. NPDC004875]|uniref:hypothetical protein n=1 Tax=Kribbella sp. NPDC004875 TaxID=3364107 RepID=UPI0036919004